ncbi:MAG TPA: flavodoxin family protein [Candidatus Deferrimicrobium sp.]|nr:flavodoxin family protein [Candidatus Deferrimicrobium sp.]
MANPISVLIVSGSPVAECSTDILLRRVAESLKAAMPDELQVDSTFVKLNDLQFRPCQACGEAPTPAFCFYDDDLTRVYDRLAECDCLLVGSPVYFDSVSAQAKAFIDRCNCFRPPDFKNVDPNHDFIKLVGRKRPGAMVLVGGEQGWYEGARRVIAGFFKWIEVVNEGTLIFHSKDFNRKGEAKDDREALSRADELGRQLAAILIRDHRGSQTH